MYTRPKCNSIWPIGIVHRDFWPSLFPSSESCRRLAQNGPFGSGLFPGARKGRLPACHNPDGVASATRLQFPDPDAAARTHRSLRKVAGHPDRPRTPGEVAAAQQADQPHRARRRRTHQAGQRGRSGPQGSGSQTLTKLSGDELAPALKYREEEASGGGQSSPQRRTAPPDAQPVQPHRARSAGRPDLARRTSFRRKTSSTASAINRRRRASRRC